MTWLTALSLVALLLLIAARVDKRLWALCSFLWARRAARREVEEASQLETLPARLLSLSSHPSASVRAAVARNPGAPREALMSVAAEFPREFWANPVTQLLLLEDPNLLWSFTHKDSAGFWVNPRTPRALLIQAAAHESAAIREQLCHNKSLPLQARLRLMHDEDEHLAATAAHSLSMYQKMTLSIFGDVGVRAQIAASYHCRWFAWMKRDPAWEVRRAVVNNPRARRAPRLLASLAGDPDYRVRMAVAHHQSTPPSALARLKRDALPEVRNAVRPAIRRL